MIVKRVHSFIIMKVNMEKMECLHVNQINGIATRVPGGGVGVLRLSSLQQEESGV